MNPLSLCLISPPDRDEREAGLLGAFLSLGLTRYHVRKPGWDETALRAWIAWMPASLRPHMVLHQCHGLVGELGLHGRHFREGESAGNNSRPGFSSRACHRPEEIPGLLRFYDALLLSPVFPSLSKPGYTLSVTDWGLGRLPEASARRAELCALGGITEARLAECRRLGFTGVAVLGAVWLAADPVATFARLLSATGNHHA
jgi:thiamine-phosphate pyrophosphorylase